MSKVVADQHIDSKLKLFYLKNNRWLVHTFYWVYVYIYGQFSSKEAVFSLAGFFQNFLFDNWLIIIFYYCFAIVLMPRYFKKNKFKQFWKFLILMVLIFPMIDLSFQYNTQHWIPERYRYNFPNYSLGELIVLFYKVYIFNFISFLAFLFLIETAEGLNNYSEEKIADNEIEANNIKILKTKIEPDYIIKSVDKIEQLASQNNANTSQTILQFSELLRYRLYRTQAELIDLEQEYLQISQLISLHNQLHNTHFSTEIAGAFQDKKIFTASLLSILIKILDSVSNIKEEQIIFYILAEASEIKVAIEWESPYSDKEKMMIEINHHLQVFYQESYHLEYHIHQNLCSIRIDLMHNHTH